MNEHTKMKFAQRLANTVDGAVTNYIISTGRKAGASTRRSIRKVALTSLKHNFPHEARALNEYLDWVTVQFQGQPASKTGRIPNHAIPDHLKDGAQIYGAYCGILSARGRARNRDLRFQSVAEEEKESVTQPTVEVDTPRQRWLDLVQQGSVPSDSTCAVLLGVDRMVVLQWREQASHEWEFHENGSGWSTQPRPRVDLAKLQELVKELSPEDLQALSDLLSESQD